ncbi:MAG: ATP-binding cassette domain-containing protein [Chloroflexota bacterium]
MRHPGRREWALRGLDLRVEPGERVLLLGRSGSGKSTLLAALAGLLDPETTETEGRLLVDGLPPQQALDRTGLLFQDPESQLVMGRAGDDVAFGLENRCVPTAEIPGRVQAALDAVDFPYGPERSTDALSGGERQRLALAGTLALEPCLLLLDEPTANLDLDGAKRLRGVLAQALEGRDATLVVVEHHVQEWLTLVDRVVIIAAGSGVVADGPPERLLDAAAPHPEARIWAPRPSAPRAASDAVPGAQLLIADGASFRYPGSSADAVGPMDVELLASEALAVTGPNGSGKSTLALLIGGLIRPREGRVVATNALAPGRASQWLAEWPARELVRHVGSVFQDPEHQFLMGTVREELMLGPQRAGLGEAVAFARADELLARLELAHVAAANPFTLSGGEKRRLSVATALATAPPLLVLDEPTFGQDPAGSAELAALVSALRDEGHGVCFVTHDESFVGAVADRVLRLPGPA